MSCRTAIVALVLFASPRALAELPVEVDASARDGGQPDARGLRDCVPTDANEDGGVDTAEGCPPVVEEAPAEPSAVPLPDWRVLEWKASKRADWHAPHASPPDPTWRMRSEPRHLAVDFDTVVGQSLHSGGFSWRPATVVSTLASLRYQPFDQLSVGAVIPLAVGYRPASTCFGDMCWGYPSHAFGTLGAIGVFGAWEPELGLNDRLALGLLVALPTSVGSTTLGWSSDGYADEGAEAFITRGLEDREFFRIDVGSCPSCSVRGSIVPNVAVSHGFGRVHLSASFKLPFMFEQNEPYSPTVTCVPAASVQAMFRIVDNSRMTLAAGLRAIGSAAATYNAGYTPAAWRGAGVSAAAEPRFEARLGAFTLRAGLVLPGVLSLERFPISWGLRVGVGYRF